MSQLASIIERAAGAFAILQVSTSSGEQSEREVVHA